MEYKNGQLIGKTESSLELKNVDPTSDDAGNDPSPFLYSADYPFPYQQKTATLTPSGLEYDSTKVTAWNTYNQPVELTGSNGIPNSTLYDAYGNVIATASNMLYNDLKTYQPGVSDELAFRDQYPEAYITTYKLNSLYQVVQQTNPNGISTYYQYDPMGRVSLVKDHNHKILQQSQFHFKNQ